MRGWETLSAGTELGDDESVGRLGRLLLSLSVRSAALRMSLSCPCCCRPVTATTNDSAKRATRGV